MDAGMSHDASRTDPTAAPLRGPDAAPARLPEVVFEDDAVIAFAKPSGLLVAPDRWDKTRVNLMGMVHERIGRHVANVHRLDADTSGLILCAKTKAALDILSGQFQSKTVHKTYHALVAVLPADRAMKVMAPIRDEQGRLPDTFTVEMALDQDPTSPGRMRAIRRHGGKPSVTDFRTLERFGSLAWVECRPQTGRTHQIRVHLAVAGAPILGDPFYGDPEIQLRLSDLKRGYKGRRDEKPLIRRMALHASSLEFTHPVTHECTTLSAPLPQEFEVALKYLRKFAQDGRAAVRRR